MVEGREEKRKREKVYDPAVVEELIFHALGCGEEEIAADEGGGLVKYLADRLAFMEAKRVGEWILQAKRAGLSSGNDAILLNNLGYLLDELGEKGKAIGYYEQALAIDEKVYGKEHPNVAISLNNLGTAYKALGELRKAIGYFEQALAIWKKVYGEEHTQVAIGLNNLGAAYFQLDRKDRARPYFEKALAILTHFFGTEHHNTKVVKEWLDLCR